MRFSSPTNIKFHMSVCSGTSIPTAKIAFQRRRAPTNPPARFALLPVHFLIRSFVRPLVNCAYWHTRRCLHPWLERSLVCFCLLWKCRGVPLLLARRVPASLDKQQSHSCVCRGQGRYGWLHYRGATNAWILIDSELD